MYGQTTCIFYCICAVVFRLMSNNSNILFHIRLTHVIIRFLSLAEAEYTYSQRKDIIPILLQQGYVPDGWLGALVGTRIYFDLTDEGTFHCQVMIAQLNAKT